MTTLLDAMTRVDADHLVVDLRDGSEIVGAVGVDMDTQSVLVAYATLCVVETMILNMPHGIRVVRRR